MYAWRMEFYVVIMMNEVPYTRQRMGWIVMSSTFRQSQEDKSHTHFLSYVQSRFRVYEKESYERGKIQREGREKMRGK